MKFTQHYLKCPDCGNIDLNVSIARCTSEFGEPEVADTINLTCPRCGGMMGWPLSIRPDLSGVEEEVREYIPTTRIEGRP